MQIPKCLSISATAPDAVEAKIEKLSRMLRMNGARLERLETVVNLNAPTSASRDA
jgi:hypothetical protein